MNYHPDLSSPQARSLMVSLMGHYSHELWWYLNVILEADEFQEQNYFQFSVFATDGTARLAPFLTGRTGSRTRFLKNVWHCRT